ncbi:hypothetical protein L6164_012420 [Bauhinia variegata]|uniref:Uncharacterized protein n=1 Tax=Bauhinia variegata TaxID=167791 RepID=A0ACB9PA16_BAUVA|nr:hypothetical protein L6164_012420 [Bauhinia variegata]
MGLSNFPSAAEGVLPVLVINTVLSMALLKNMFRSVLQVVGGSESGGAATSESDSEESSGFSRERRISITQYKSLFDNSSAMADTTNSSTVECCVCLSRFEANQEVSQLSCNHFFHRGCLDKWFHNKHSTCPLCRSID